jgi:DNA-binding MarR family transcriptional regulator
MGSAADSHQILAAYTNSEGTWYGSHLSVQRDIGMDNSSPQGQASELHADEESRTVLDSVRRIVQLLRRSANVSEKQVGLSSAQIFVLHKLADVTTLSVGELAERTLTSQSSVSEVVQKLVTRGFVARTRSVRDARSVELSLTDAGRQLLSRAPVAPQDTLLAGLNRMPPRDRKQLARLLGRLVKETGMVNVTLSPKMLFEEEDESESAGVTSDSDA